MTTKTSRDRSACVDCAILRNTPRETRSAGSEVSLAVSAALSGITVGPSALSLRGSSLDRAEDKQSPLPRLEVHRG